jgi:hypothetical protein
MSFPETSNGISDGGTDGISTIFEMKPVSGLNALLIKKNRGTSNPLPAGFQRLPTGVVSNPPYTPHGRWKPPAPAWVGRAAASRPKVTAQPKASISWEERLSIS